MSYTPTSSFTLSGSYTPTTTFDFITGDNVSLPSGTLTFTGYALSFESTGEISDIPAGTLTFTGYAVQTDDGDYSQFSEIPTGTFTLTGYAVDCDNGGVDNFVNNGYGALTLTGYAGSINNGHTYATFTNWLTNASPRRCILVEVNVYSGGSETTRYLSTTGYVTNVYDSPSNTAYIPIISGGLNFTESLELDSTGNMQFGDIEIMNADGAYDSWLDDVWSNREITVYIGDLTWLKADFEIIFRGLVSDISSKSRDTLNLKVRDKMERLNTPITDTKLGGVWLDSDKLVPLTFGEVCNLEPILIDEPTHTYKVHDSKINSVIEVRDNGYPVEITEDLDNGEFSLVANPYGTITCSIQGSANPAYINRIGALIQRIVKSYGKTTTQFSDSDIDTTNFSDFDTANPQPVGIFIDSRQNIINIVQGLAESIGAQLVMSRDGLLQIYQINFPITEDADYEIGISDMVEGSFELVEKRPVTAAFKIGYNKNWTIQKNLQTGIPEHHKDFFEEEWLTVTATDNAVATLYKLNDDPKQKDTYLLTEIDATAEANRLLDIYKEPRFVYRFEGSSTLMPLRLLDVVNITHPRFGFSGGKKGLVTQIAVDWINYRVKIEVMV